MAKTELQKQLAQVQHDYRAEFLKLQDKLNKKTKTLLKEAGKQLAFRLNSVADYYRTIPTAHREQIWRESSLKKALNTLGLRPRESKGQIGPGKGRRSKVTDEQILEIMKSDSVTTQMIKLNFGWSAVTVSKRMDALLKAKKVTVEKVGTAKYWKKA